jgi:hypothetical protein
VQAVAYQCIYTLQVVGKQLPEILKIVCIRLFINEFKHISLIFAGSRMQGALSGCRVQGDQSNDVNRLAPQGKNMPALLAQIDLNGCKH